MNRKGLIIGLVLAGVLALGGGLFLRQLTDSVVQTHTVDGYVDLVVNGEIGSAAGISRTRILQFQAFPQPELLWIVGYRAEAVAADGGPTSPELNLQSGVDFDAVRHARIFELPIADSDRLFTLPGVPTEVSLPAGFGLPFYSDETLKLTSWVLEPVPTDLAANLRHQVSVRYVLDRDLDEPMKPLFVTAGRSVDSADAHAGDQTMRGHVVTRVLRPAYDTRMHLITNPMQPLLESIELRDPSTGETVYSSGSGGDEAGAEDGRHFSSEQGVKLLEGHDYELVGSYDTTHPAEPGVSVALEVYLRDKLFKKRPRYLASVTHIDEPVKIGEERLVVYTNLGEFQIGLYPEAAPRHVERIHELSRLGVYDGVPFHRIEPGFLIQLGYPEGRLGPPLTPEQQAALVPLKAEITDLPQRRWTVSMALSDNADPDSGAASFFILCDEVRRLDQRFTIIGRILGGLGTLNRIVNVPLDGSVPIEPVFIERTELMTRAEIIAAREAQ